MFFDKFYKLFFRRKLNFLEELQLESKFDRIEKRLEKLETVAHEPQNFIDKCERN